MGGGGISQHRACQPSSRIGDHSFEKSIRCFHEQADVVGGLVQQLAMLQDLASTQLVRAILLDNCIILPMTIMHNCFQIPKSIMHTHEAVFNPANIPIPSGLDIEDDFQHLQDLGFLSSQNQMLISELLDPGYKTLLGSTPTSQEIYKLTHVSQDDAEYNMIKTKTIPTSAEAIKYLNGLVAHIKGTATSLGLKLDKLLQKYSSQLKS